jgi:hypothetical protein
MEVVLAVKKDISQTLINVINVIKTVKLVKTLWIQVVLVANKMVKILIIIHYWTHVQVPVIKDFI